MLTWQAAERSGSVKLRQQLPVLCERAEPRDPEPSERGTGAACDCEMGTENKEVIPKEEISEEAEPHGAILEKVAKMLYQGQKLGAVCEDMLERLLFICGPA
ncbi:Zinc Finger Protein 3-like [Manis pentadactyla]|nr:Zinc Finger Protein 3-like [Manis pentadactyla]